MTQKQDELSPRKSQILLSAVEDYIQQASPITSSNIQHKCSLELSTATLRNELNALEAMGYLKQLHTSGGRVPTSKGYRYFVNSLMEDVPLDKYVLNEIQSLFDERTVYLGDIINDIADIVSKATNYPTVVMLKGFEKLIIKNIKIIPLMTGQALILIETNSGVINNSMKTSNQTPMQTYIDASNFLTKTFEGQTVADLIKNIRSYKGNMSKELTEYKSIFDALIGSLNRIIDQIGEHKFSAKGQLKLLDSPEYSDLSKAKPVIEAINNHDEMEELFTDDVDNDDGVSFKIGSEIPVKDLQDCAVVRADYSVGDETTASIGIIGPQRMDYAKIASALKFVVGEFNNLKLLNNEPDESKKGEHDE